MQKLLLIVTLSFQSLFVYAQPAIQWQKAYGGTGAEALGAGPNSRLDIQQTTDGGYVFVGTTGSTDGQVTGNHGGGDIWVVKTDNTGTIQWQKCYGGTKAEIGCSIAQTKDGGYIVSGYTNSNDGDVTGHHGQNDLWVLKLDNMGTLTWQKALGGTSFDEFAYSVVQAKDGSYAVSGITYSSDGDITGGHGSAIDIWVAHITATGSMDWQKCLGGTGIEMVGSIDITKDGGYIVAGTAGNASGDITSVYGGSDGWLVKLSATGSIQWQKNYGGTKQDGFTMAHETTDGGFVVSGYTTSKDNDISNPHDSTELWVVKTDNAGKITWSKTFGGASADIGISIAQATDGSFLASGITTSTDGDISGVHGIEKDMVVMNIKTDGTLKWAKVIGTSKAEMTSKVTATADGGCIVVGLVLDAIDDAAGSGWHGSGDVWVVKLGTGTDVPQMKTAGETLKVYPVPTNNIVQVNLPAGNEDASIELYNLSGQRVNTIVTRKGGAADVDMKELPAATYLLRVVNGEQAWSSRVVYEP